MVTYFLMVLDAKDLIWVDDRQLSPEFVMKIDQGLPELP